jgi:hypothetical protein
MIMIFINFGLNIIQIVNNGFTFLSHLLDPLDDSGLFLEIELFEMDKDFGGLLG